MALAPGTRLGPYEIQALAGSGGMGEVYRARDTRLRRDVAIKVIGASLGNDPEMRRRFDQEATLAASLDHPRICAVYDVGHDAGIDYLVMEFLEGHSLAVRLQRGPLPIAELTGYAIEIASALAYAHARHVIHRDVKPGNVLLTPSGVKVVDFGLARLRQLEGKPSADIGAMKTRQLPATERGIVQGTPEYVPPERLEGREGDHRSDIFAFGVLIYEMATARRAFESPTPAGLITAIMASEPPPMVGHGTATRELEWVVRRCLKKDPDARWQSMSDVEAVLKWIAAGGGPWREKRARPRGARRGRYAAAGLAALLAVALIWAFGQTGRRTATAAPASLVTLTVPPPEDGVFTLTGGSVSTPQLAISPDGRTLAFVAAGPDGVSQIWIRPIDSTTARPVGGTVNATYPFWSPTSRTLGFFADDALRRVDVDGGPARFIVAAANGRGGTWAADNTILFAPSTAGRIERVNADGSGHTPQTAFTPERADLGHRWPQFLPDGRHFLFFARSSEQKKEGVYLGSLDAPSIVFLVETSFGAVYSPPGQLLYVADGTLMARDIDVEHGRLTGEPVPTVAGVAGSSNFYAAFSASSNGVVAYASSTVEAEISWFNRAGQKLGVAAERGEYTDFRVSRDGLKLALSQVDPQTDRPDIHIRDLSRGDKRRLTWSRATDASPVWSPDGTRLVFRSNRHGVHDLFMRPVNGSGDDQVFLASHGAKYPTAWSSTGDFIVYHADLLDGGWDIYGVSTSLGAKPELLVHTKFDEVQGQISPDGRRLAYTSFMTSDRPEVYIEPARPKPNGQKWELSVDGGLDPHWRADGTEVFYVRLSDKMLMSVRVPEDESLPPEKPKPLFPLPDVRLTGPYSSVYDVDPSGERFLVRVPLKDAQRLPLTVMVNWAPQPTPR